MRWYEIGECLEQLLCKQPAIDPICHHYVEEFLDFLCLRGLASTPVKTTLSAALTAYRAKTGGLPLYNYRFRSLESLNQYEELEPLVSLLKLMDMAIQSLVPSLVVRFDTGRSNGGWIGYNLNRMEYFFYIKLDRPETVVFETYRRQINETTWDNSKGEDFKRGGRWRWRNQLDLSDAQMDFFNSSKAVQLSILEQFLQTSYAYAQQFTLSDQ